MTYSFGDLSVVFNHPSVGQFTFQGAGLGQITFSRTNNLGQKDVAADGTAMTSKITSKVGTITIQVQQPSEANKFMRKYVNYVETASASEFATASLVASSPAMGVTHTATGVNPEKMPDWDYQQAGQMVSYVLQADALEGEV